jgi:hypothetical protein
MPMTYILGDKSDMIRLWNNNKKQKKLYIMKNNIQRQQGLKITDDVLDITRGWRKYVIAQELLQDPYLIDGRKINMRIYLMVICHNGHKKVYASRNGFMYYTKVPFKKNSIKLDDNVTTGYIDREVYEKNPLTLYQFREYLNDVNRPKTEYEQKIIYKLEDKNMKLSEYVFSRIYGMLSKVMEAGVQNVCTKSSLDGNISFQHFGADISLSDTFNAHLMEINKGPDMGAKDETDGNLKKKVYEDIFKLVGLLPNENNEFIEIYSE